MADWKNTDNRFVAFFDIMGFKDLVQRNSHEAVLEKLQKLKQVANYLGSPALYNDTLSKHKFDEDQTRTITFSDSIIIFSKENKLNDAKKIVFDISLLAFAAFKNHIPIKGALLMEMSL